MLFTGSQVIIIAASFFVIGVSIASLVFVLTKR